MPPPLTAEDNVSNPQPQPTRRYPDQIQKPPERLLYSTPSC